MRRSLSVGLLALAIGLATAVGWLLVPGVGLVWGLTARAGTAPPTRRRPVLEATLAAGLAWAGWLLYDAVAGHGGLGRLGARLAPLLHAPFPILLAVTVLFGMVLAGTAAAVGTGLGSALAGRGPARRSPA